MKLRFCPECAAPLTQINQTVYHCANGHPFYNNPHGACSIIFMNEKRELLYAERAHEPAKGKYDFPGGFLDYGEDAYHAACREAQEELGITITISNLTLIDCSANEYDENTYSCDFVFLCRNWSGQMTPADDVATVSWKPFSFIESPEFAWAYPGLLAKLERITTS